MDECKFLLENAKEIVKLAKPYEIAHGMLYNACLEIIRKDNEICRLNRVIEELKRMGEARANGYRDLSNKYFEVCTLSGEQIAEIARLKNNIKKLLGISSDPSLEEDQWVGESEDIYLEELSQLHAELDKYRWRNYPAEKPEKDGHCWCEIKSVMPNGGTFFAINYYLKDRWLEYDNVLRWTFLPTSPDVTETVTKVEDENG